MKSMGIVLLQGTFQFTTCANVSSHSIIHVVLKTSDGMPIIIQLDPKKTFNIKYHMPCQL